MSDVLLLESSDDEEPSEQLKSVPSLGLLMDTYKGTVGLIAISLANS